ncbi:hypothetical protein AB0C52_33535 [Streptomyces sp. NPDC048717]|uniref:hypothetical protein n=1 Tax=Streptomyces sp. NPDC048717 TaxID=3154928 RepID=UPI00343AFD96
MGHWLIVARYDNGADSYRTDLVAEVTGDREQAEEALRRAALTYRAPMREKRRQVYRMGESDSYLVRVKGRVSATETVLSLAELVYDSAEPDGTPKDRHPAW